MLKAGLGLLVNSAIMILLRFSEVAFFQGSSVKWLCFFGLTGALGLFIAYYLKRQSFPQGQLAPVPAYIPLR